MKIFLPFLLLIVSLSAFGQFSSSLDCVGAMNIGYRYINPHKSDVPSGFVDIRNKEQVGLRADFGLNFNKKFGSKLYFKTGLRMANKGYNSYKLNTLKWGLDGKDGVYHPDFPTGGTEDKSSQFKYHYFFLEMPVMIVISICTALFFLRIFFNNRVTLYFWINYFIIFFFIFYNRFRLWSFLYCCINFNY